MVGEDRAVADQVARRGGNTVVFGNCCSMRYVRGDLQGSRPVPEAVGFAEISRPSKTFVVILGQVLKAATIPQKGVGENGKLAAELVLAAPPLFGYDTGGSKSVAGFQSL